MSFAQAERMSRPRQSSVHSDGPTRGGRRAATPTQRSQPGPTGGTGLGAGSKSGRPPPPSSSGAGLRGSQNHPRRSKSPSSVRQASSGRGSRSGSVGGGANGRVATALAAATTMGAGIHDDQRHQVTISAAREALSRVVARFKALQAPPLQHIQSRPGGAGTGEGSTSAAPVRKPLSRQRCARADSVAGSSGNGGAATPPSEHWRQHSHHHGDDLSEPPLSETFGAPGHAGTTCLADFLPPFYPAATSSAAVAAASAKRPAPRATKAERQTTTSSSSRPSSRGHSSWESCTPPSSSTWRPSPRVRTLTASSGAAGWTAPSHSGGTPNDTMTTSIGGIEDDQPALPQFDVLVPPGPLDSARLSEAVAHESVSACGDAADNAEPGLPHLPAAGASAVLARVTAQTELAFRVFEAAREEIRQHAISHYGMASGSAPGSPPFSEISPSFSADHAFFSVCDRGNFGVAATVSPRAATDSGVKRTEMADTTRYKKITEFSAPAAAAVQGQCSERSGGSGCRGSGQGSCQGSCQGSVRVLDARPHAGWRVGDGNGVNVFAGSGSSQPIFATVTRVTDVSTLPTVAPSAASATATPAVPVSRRVIVGGSVASHGVATPQPPPPASVARSPQVPLQHSNCLGSTVSIGTATTRSRSISPVPAVRYAAQIVQPPRMYWSHGYPAN
eukprot:TRINITY_DN38703_c0_g1_i1.p1 TRINITY_DN38703_c0_g1~~TRINITY_DN38703_c0_g1_i1.p1  ORF type:complete len:675 (+),score=99.91 TRINITY_DN38703_c0_g1_i1:168-2192(+)